MHWLRHSLLLFLVAWFGFALGVQPAGAETRLETFNASGLSGSLDAGFGLDLVEVDLGQKASMGFRRSSLGVREETGEVFLRVQQKKSRSAYDPRDKRSHGGKNPVSSAETFHIGVIGLETDGTRGNPMAVKAGVYTLRRVKEDLMGVSEFGYQSGTFGGDGTRPTNTGGLFSRLGMRKAISSSFYGEIDYSFSPGVEKSWTPQVRVGMAF